MSDTAEPHCGRRLKDPWWYAVRNETLIAIWEGAKDAEALRQVIDHV